jgi:hypothetical protein
VKVESLMYYSMSKFHFITLISQFMRAIFRAAHNFWEPLYMVDYGSGCLVYRNLGQAHRQEVGLTKIPGDRDFLIFYTA